MKAIVFQLETLQPLLATSFQGDPNSDVSYPYIPGSMIRGALIGRYLSRNKNVDIVVDELSRRLFFDGTTRYLNAYPQSQTGKRTFPLLLSWRKEKGEELTEDKPLEVYDFSIDKKTLDHPPKSLGEGFWIEERGAVRLYNIDRRINIHHSRDRQKGRATAEDGEIFRYDAIDVGQTFQGVILCDREEDADIIKTLLDPADIWMGGSRSAGYGHIRISAIQSQDDWQEIEQPAEDRESDNHLKVTLLSDLILQDASGQAIAMPPTDLIAETIGIEPKSVYMESTFIGGFNRKWGLPLLQVPAVKAGSVFVYEGVNIAADRIRELEREGIGERTIDGFGRIAINWREKEDFKMKKTESNNRNRSSDPLQDESIALAGKMAERILRQKLEAVLLKEVDTYKLHPVTLSNSQLSRLMLVARKAIDEKSDQLLRKLLANLPDNTRRQYEKMKVGASAGVPLRDKLAEWLNNPCKWLEGDIKEVSIAGQTAPLTDELALEYTLRLIMAIAKNALKEDNNE